MSIKFFEDEKASQYVDVPYLEDYYEENPECIGEVHQVVKVVFTNKGMLAITEKFSSFLWRSSVSYKNLKEALPLWTSRSRKKFKKGLVGQISPQRNSGKQSPVKLRLGIDETLDAEWKESSSSTGKQSFELVSSPHSQDGGENQNPLLVSS